VKPFLAAVAVAVVLFVVTTWGLFQLNVAVAVSPTVAFEVEQGESVRQVAARLEDAGVVRSKNVLLLLARLNKLDRTIRHGVHEFAGALTPADVLVELQRRPPQPTVAVTIPEGLNWSEIGALLEQAGLITAAQYEEAACDPSARARMGARAEANCLEGYLFPDTYALVPGMSAAEIVDIQLARFREVMAALLAADDAYTGNALVERTAAGSESEAAGEPLAPDVVSDLVVLASIIEKETGVGEERPLVASVFHNRLRRGMKLQTDPTVVYGLHASGTAWDGTKLHRRLKIPGPYNTYTISALPPGPICNPGLAALAAALRPAESPYLYFVARPEGGAHRFSVTLDEHNRAVAQLRNR